MIATLKPGAVWRPLRTRGDVDKAVAEDWPGVRTDGLTMSGALLVLRYGPNWMTRATAQELELARYFTGALRWS